MKKQYLSKNQINKLKQELMSKNKKGNKKGSKNGSINGSKNGSKNIRKRSRSPSLSSVFYQMDNIKVGRDFENNVKNIIRNH